MYSLYKMSYLYKAFDRVCREVLFILPLMAKWYPRQILYLVLGSLYKEAGSRAFFGDYESDWLSQDYGGKQPNIVFASRESVA